ncbi:MAG: Serine/threonine-protein kinase pkn3, partial [Myxococcaceae bacterium]|nr:Serine/threonine-protein kinase pkn3 [Myxococcaceae bacterium]
MFELGEGSELAKKYRVGKLLGEGGMATVFEGEHMRLGQKVAIKVLHEELRDNAELIARFEREGRALSKLKSQHVVRVFDVDETPNGVPFLVMERLEGSDLDQEIAARGALPIAEAVGYVMQACSAMEEAHAVGIVHRDLKPSNLFLTTEGGARIVKVLDFGIATDALPENGKRLTQTASVMGTPVYMAPEQFRRTRDVDGRADIWALGATLYEMLTAMPPFSGTPSTIGVAVVNDDYPPIEESRPDTPVELRAVIARTLEKDPAKRFA